MNGSVVLPLHDHSIPYQKTAGALLREARELKELSQEDVASRLNLMTSHIVAMECDAYNPHLEGKYFSTYLKEYARLVDLNPQILLGLYQGSVEQPGARVHPFQSTKRSGTSLRLTVVVAMLAVAWWFTQQGHTSASLTQLVRSLPSVLSEKDYLSLPAASTTREPEYKRVSTGVQQQVGLSTSSLPSVTGDMNTETQAVGSLSEVELDAVSQAAAVTEQQSSLEEYLASAGQVRVLPSASHFQGFRLELDGASEAGAAFRDDTLLFEFEDSCWVEVYDSEQNPIVMDTKLQGESLRIVGKAPFEVRVGNSRAVRLTLNGEPVHIEQHPTIDSTELIVGRR